MPRGATRGRPLAGDDRAPDGGGEIVLPPPRPAGPTRRQPGRRGGAAAEAPAPPADALALGGRAADRRGSGNDAALTPGPRTRRAAVRSRTPRRRGRRPRQNRR